MKRPRRDEPQRGIFNIEYLYFSKDCNQGLGVDTEKVIDMSNHVCYNTHTALRFELSSHRGGFLMGGLI